MCLSVIPPSPTFFLFLTFETGSFYVVQASLEHLDSSDLPVSACWLLLPHLTLLVTLKGSFKIES